MERKQRLSRVGCPHRRTTVTTLLRTTATDAGSMRTIVRPEAVAGDPALTAAVSRHVRTHIGPIENVLHMDPHAPVHVDMHHVPPSQERRFHTFVTSGMSQHPMIPPAEAEDCDHAELVLLLPETWPMWPGALRQQENRWPIQLLSDLASYPHRHDAWLWEGHTVADAEPPTPLAEGVGFCCATLTRPNTFGKGFYRLRESSGRTIHFFTVELLFEDEMRFAHRYGISSLFERFETASVPPVVDLLRPSLCSDPDAIM